MAFIGVKERNGKTVANFPHALLIRLRVDMHVDVSLGMQFFGVFYVLMGNAFFSCI